MKIGKYKKYIFILIIAVFLEIFLFNWRFFESMGYEPVTPGSFECGAGLEYLGNDCIHVKEKKDAYIEFKNFSVPVKNVYLDIVNKGYCVEGVYYCNSDSVAVELNIADEANRDYMYVLKPVNMPERTVVQSVEPTKYLRLHSAGESNKLKINIVSALDQELYVREVSFNKPVPFSFNVTRFFWVYGALLLIFAIRRGSAVYNEKCVLDTNQRLVRIAAMLLNLFFVMLIVFSNPYLSDEQNMNQYNRLADAFIEGKLYLNIEPSKALKGMDNPYDSGVRDQIVGIFGYEWDTAYYNGRYYVYFGALPALVYHLPYKLLTGQELPNKLGVMVNCWMYIIFAYALMEVITERWFKNIPFINYMLLSQVLICASGISFAIRCANLYASPITMAMALTVMGLYFWISAGMCSGRFKQGLNLCVGSLCMALVSACRPQFLIASFLAIPLFWSEVFKKRELFSKKSIGRSLAFVLPYIAVAAVVMWYNYARFGSVLDFGANYNLTTNDMTKRGFVLGRLPLGIFAYLFQPPYLCSVFPFIKETDLSTSYMGVTIYEAMFGGILVSQPFLWLIYYTRSCAEALKKKGLFAFTVVSMVLSVMVVCADTEMAGVLHRYYMDFSYLMVLAVILIALTLIEKGDRKMYSRVSVLCLGSIIYSTLSIFVKYAVGLDYNPDFYYDVASSVCFWL